VKLNVRTFTSTTRDVTTWTTCYGNIRYRDNIYHGINLLKRVKRVKTVIF